jgi:hypothetical protein
MTKSLFRLMAYRTEQNPAYVILEVLRIGRKRHDRASDRLMGASSEISNGSANTCRFNLVDHGIGPT